MKTMRIIPWNEQLVPVNGNWTHAYKVVYSTHAWIKTPEQKRRAKIEEEQQTAIEE